MRAHGQERSAGTGFGPKIAVSCRCSPLALGGLGAWGTSGLPGRVTAGDLARRDRGGEVRFNFWGQILAGTEGMEWSQALK